MSEIFVNKPKEISFNPEADFIAEPKLDGMRGIIRSHGFNEYELISDHGTNKKIQFPEIIPKFQEGTVIDGEICVMKNEYLADFEALQKRINVQNTQIINHYTKTIPVKFVAFDILRYKDKDLTGMEYKERRKILEPLIQHTTQPNIVLSEQGSLNKMWNNVMKYDGEGIVVKKIHGKYDDLWIKQKNWKEDDFIVSGVEERKVNWVLNLVDRDNKDVGNVTLTGYKRTDDLKQKIIGMTAVIKYLGFGNKLRIPILKELRPKRDMELRS